MILNVDVVGVLDVMVSVLVVFFLEFWRRLVPQPPVGKGLPARPGSHLGFAPGGFKVVKHAIINIINKVPFIE